MSIPSFLLTTTCDIYRPFGAVSPTATGIPCRLVADMPRGHSGRGTYSPSPLLWTHYLDLDATVDVRDGCVRPDNANVLAYTDGDEVRVPTGGSGLRFVVIWVEVHNQGTTRDFKRVYLMRHGLAQQ